MVRVAAIFGTRPDTIKMSPVLAELKKYPREFRTIAIATAQHREMLDQVLRIFRIRVDYDLNVMRPRQPLSHIVGSSLTLLDKALRTVRPDLVLVQGDTSTTFVGSLAAFYHRIPVGHLEAGLRTDDKYRPFPEEMNRKLTGALADFHFAPTATARDALLAEKVDKERIFVTGNTVIDALLATIEDRFQFKRSPVRQILEETMRSKKRIVLITCHRRENWGAPMKSACTAIRELSSRYRNVEFLFPVHLNPIVRDIVSPMLGGIENVHLIEPLDYKSFVNLMSKSYLILTDSGGVQEEAPSLGKPVLVLREVTERPEAIQAGTVKLVGLDEKKIFSETVHLLESPKAYRRMANAANPYGDGKAAWRIVQILRWHYGFRRTRVKEFQG
jgi:UDP-N-acetylglucosamine 2-epimerase (non-hydrolysing)